MALLRPYSYSFDKPMFSLPGDCLLQLCDCVEVLTIDDRQTGNQWQEQIPCRNVTSGIERGIVRGP
jgi:hypothetical protein